MAPANETGLWQRSLGANQESLDAEEFRERLVTGLKRLRERAVLLAKEIAADHPDFTVHDETHFDAFWDLADRIAGPELTLTPTEAFVFGAAALIHDLGMASAAYVGGAEAIRDDPRWPDRVAWVLRKDLGRPPRPEELAAASDEVASAATATLLRELHAERAELLPTASWPGASGRTYELLEDDLLREVYGPTVGLVAHSHWWSLSTLAERFTNRLGAPPGCPAAWTAQPLIAACLLRLADASHIDASRAPRFLQALNRPSGVAALHWEFQAHLSQPFVERDRFVFTGTPFEIDEASAWWLCADTVKIVDREFRSVDALLADREETRFAVRGVAGADDLGRLAEYIPPKGWTPADARVQVSDVVRLVDRMGGSELYGDRPYVPLRELIQNASDAVRARREIGSLGPGEGQITVRLRPAEEEGRHWLEVEDTGVGMSSEVLSNHLLDFGQSFWESELVLAELPGLSAKGFVSTGRFGIGFFSVFMWSQEVKVTSWRSGADTADTHVLEFSEGLSRRPLLRPASATERLVRPGTRVGVLVEDDLLYRLGVEAGAPGPSALPRLCAWLAPALDVDLVVEDDGHPPETAVAAGDWIELPMVELAARIDDRPAPVGPYHEPRPAWSRGDAEDMVRRGRQAAMGEHARVLTSAEGVPIGRAILDPADVFPGAVVTGGLRAGSMRAIGGILFGEPTTIARQVALPLVEAEPLAGWASQQALLVAPALSDQEALVAAHLVEVCGGDTGPLPIVHTCHGQMSREATAEWLAERDEVLMLLSFTGLAEEDELAQIELNEGVVVTQTGHTELIDGSEAHLGRRGWPTAIGNSEIVPFGPFVPVIEQAWGSAFIHLTDNFVETEIGRRDGAEVQGSALLLHRPDR
jgi:hypothetical protein